MVLTPRLLLLHLVLVNLVLLQLLLLLHIYLFHEHHYCLQQHCKLGDQCAAPAFAAEWLQDLLPHGPHRTWTSPYKYHHNQQQHLLRKARTAAAGPATSEHAHI
jgi:hypothetical protein